MRNRESPSVFRALFFLVLAFLLWPYGRKDQGTAYYVQGPRPQAEPSLSWGWILLILLVLFLLLA